MLGLLLIRAMTGAWQIAIAISVVACKPRGTPEPVPVAAIGDPLWGYAGEPRIPQLVDADAVFDALPAERTLGSVRAGLLVCRIDAKYNEATKDPASDPDLTMAITIGGAPMRIVWGASDSWRATMSVAAVDLARGDRVRVEGWDNDDLTSNERIGEITQTFDGSLPLVLRTDAMTVECRAMAQSELAARVATAMREADAALDALDRALVPNFTAADLNFPKQQVAAARRSITSGAAYVGWNVVDIQRRVVREQQLDREWTRRVRARVDALVAESRPPGELVPIARSHVSVAGKLTCDPASVCVVVVELAPDEGSPLDVFYSSGLSVRLIARDGTSFSTSEVRAQHGTTVTHPDKLTVTFNVHDDMKLQPELAVVRMRKSEPVLIRVR